MKRRRLLATVGVVSTSLSACLEPGLPQDAVVRAVQESPSEDVTSVSYDDLTQAEQQIVRTAIEEDFYHACPELPEAVRSLAGRFEDPDSSYLKYQGTSYAVWIRIEDTIRAETASPPDNEPSCGWI